MATRRKDALMAEGSVTTHTTSFPAPCRVCGGPSWREDGEGAVHPCCVMHGNPCLACEASKMLNREQRRRERRHHSRLPTQLVPDSLTTSAEGKSLQDQEVE